MKLNVAGAIFISIALYEPQQDRELLLDDALTLFRRLGVDVRSISDKEFTAAYFTLAKRYHPDRAKANTHELMANINAARTTILNHHSEM